MNRRNFFSAFAGGLFTLQERTFRVTATEKFVPPDLEDAKMIAAGIGGQADGTTKAFIQVDYIHGKDSYRAMLAQRNDAAEAMQDCANWFAETKKPLMDALLKKQTGK